MGSDWEDDSGEEGTQTAPAPPKVVPKKKWEGEDEDDDSAPDDWEASSEEEEEQVKPAVVAPPRKKGTLKAKIAEKEASKLAEEEEEDEVDDVPVDEAEKRRLDKERELKADLSNAADLFGSTSLDSKSSKELESLLTFNPRTQADFETLSSRIIDLVMKRLESKPNYHMFVEHHAKQLVAPLRDVEVRKVASGLTAIANEKQKEQRDKVSGKKKPKAAAKPTLGSTKVAAKVDTNAYDDFGDEDFM